MQIMFLLLISLGLLFTSCGESTEETKLKASVPKEKMISILIDIHLLEARAEEFKMLNDSFITAKRAAYDSIFKKHNIEKELFMNSFEYYEKNPSEMDELYEYVVDSFSVMEANLKEKAVEETVDIKEE